jgi:hypothetical protein
LAFRAHRERLSSEAMTQRFFVQIVRSWRRAVQKRHGAIDGRTTRHAGDALNPNKSNLAEEILGWGKTIGGQHKARFVRPAS